MVWTTTTITTKLPDFQSMIFSIAEWIWRDTPNPHISPEVCLAGFPMRVPPDCSIQVGIKLMGIGMILGACLNKAPTLINIIQSKSTAGLPKTSIYGEIIIAANATLYGYVENFPFTAYGENAAIAIQCAMVMLLMWQYSSYDNHHHHHRRLQLPQQQQSATTTTTTTTMNKPKNLVLTTQSEKVAVTCFSIVYIFAVIHYLPKSYHYLLMSSVMPIMIYSRGCQILEANSIQHTGAQSIVTTTISLGGNLGRILTTIKEVGLDYTALSWYLLSSILNSIMCFQYFLYRKNTKLFLEEMKQQTIYVLPKEA